MTYPHLKPTLWRIQPLNFGHSNSSQAMSSWSLDRKSGKAWERPCVCVIHTRINTQVTKKNNSSHTVVAVAGASLCETPAVYYHFWSKRKESLLPHPKPYPPHLVSPKHTDYVMWSLSQHPDDKQHPSITKICRRCCLIVCPFSCCSAKTRMRSYYVQGCHHENRACSNWECRSSTNTSASISKRSSQSNISDAWLAVDT